MLNQTYPPTGMPPSGGYPMYGPPSGYMNSPMQGAFPGLRAQSMMPSSTNGVTVPTPSSPVAGQVFEESYIENILRLNLGKMATIYMTFENNPQWNAKVFKGKLEAAGRDHIIISDPKSGMRYLLLMVNLDYITFDEQLQYAYPTMGTSPSGR